MNIEIINIPKVEDYRGNLAIIEKDIVPFEIKRVYYLFDVPSTAHRGGHSHIEQLEVLIALSGSFDVVVKDGIFERTVNLNKPDKGLLIHKNIWRELENFYSGAVCLVIASYVFKDFIGLYCKRVDFLNYENTLFST